MEDKSINVAVDVGENVRSLIEQLASTIGTTADKIYPYYVNDVFIRSITGACTLIAITTIGYILTSKYKKADFDDGNPECVMTIVGICILCVALIQWVGLSPTLVSGILNPEYRAIHDIIADASKLIP